MAVNAPNTLSRSGLVLAIVTYSVWGAFPLYFNLLEGISATEVLAHRIVWSFVFTLVLVAVLGLLGPIREALSQRANLKYFLISSVLIAVNWLLYVYGVARGDVLELSLAFFINPIFNVIFGVFFFKERLSLATIVAVVLVVLGLMIQLSDLAHFPILAIALALIFSLYGVVRKQTSVDSVSGLFIEIVVLVPFAFLYLLIYGRDSSLFMMLNDGYWAMIFMLAGPLTSLPLITFAMAARRIPYYLLGFCQYLTPTFLLLLAVFLYKETLSPLRWLTFSLVWAGIVLSIGQGVWSHVKYKRRPLQ